MELSPKNISVVIPTRGGRDLESIKCALEGEGFEDIIFVYDLGKKLYNRYFGAFMAKNDWIYTQDDDCIVKNIPELIKNANPSKITANMQASHASFYKKEKNGGNKVCLIGWGAIFNRKLLKVIDEYLKKMPEDELFLREFDRVFTYLNEKNVILTDKIEHLKVDDNAMSLESRHWDDLHSIIKLLKQYEKENSVH